MKIINILFCLFLIILNSCNANDNDTFKNKNKPIESQQAKNGKKYDLGQKKLQKELPKEPQKEIPKSREELIKEKLTDDEKTHLDWLKAAITNAGDFDRFLQNDENKIKIALAHIKTELDKCKGKQFAAREEANFKDIVNIALRGNDIDEVQQAICMCDIYP